MTQAFSYSTTYVLDKSHFSETFDESGAGLVTLSSYYKAFTFFVIGAGLLFTKVSAYLGWFILAVGILEGLNVRFKKPWWLTRQMLSRAANSELTLTIDEQGVHTKSFYVDSTLRWQDLTKIDQTIRGWLLYQGTAKSYLSNRCLSDQAKAFVAKKSETTL